MKATSGTSAIELALAAPVVILMFFGICEFSRLFWTQHALQYAVQAAARCAALGLSQCDNTADTKSYAASAVLGPTVPASAFTVSSCANNGEQVSVTFSFSFAVPSLFPWKLTLSSQSCYPGAQS